MIEKNTLYGAVENSAKRFPARTALYYMGAKISYKKLMREIDAVAGWLTTRGIAKGDVVTLCMPNIPQCVIAFYAVNKIGAVAHMVHPLSPQAQLIAYMDQVNSKMLVLPDIMAKKYPDIVGKKDILLCSPAYYLGAFKNKLFSIKNKTIGICDESKRVFSYAKAVKKVLPSPLDSDEYAGAVYLHSGGTSGLPKTIELSSHAINALCYTGGDMLCEDPGSGSMLAVLPMFHGFGLAMGVHALLCFGGCDTLMPKFRPSEVIKLIKKNKINYIIGVPTLYEALLARPAFTGAMLKNVRRAFVGGDFVSHRLIDEFNARMEQNGSSARLSEGYGLTETVTVCAVNTVLASKKGSVGKAITGMEITAFENGKPLKAGELGELCIAGEDLMNGYLGDENASAGVFFTYDGKKYVRSGDMGIVDEDGFVFFKSRIKRIAKVNGVTVFPSQIENLCMNECPFVREACAVSFADERTGESIYLFATLKEDCKKDKDDIKKEISALIESNLSSFATPKKVFFLPELPKTLVGKIDSNKLIDIYLK